MAHACILRLVTVGIDQSDEFLATLHHHTLDDIRHGVEFVLYFLRIDVLSVGTEEHILRSTFYIYVAILVEQTKVASVIPALIVEHLGRLLFILVIAKHHVDASCENLARDIQRVWTVDDDLLMLGSLAARSWFKLMPVLIADDRRTLRSTIAHGVRESYLVQEGVHILIEGSATHDDLIEVATESLIHLVANLRVDLVLEKWSRAQHLHQRTLHLREHLLLDDLFYDERHGDDNSWLHLCESLCYDGRRRSAGEEIDVYARTELEEEFECHAIHVCHWQDAHRLVSRFDVLAEDSLREVIVAPHGVVRNHHALGETCRAARVVDDSQLLGRRLAVVVHMLLAEIFRIFLAKNLIEMLAGISEFVGAAHRKRIVGYVDDTLQIHHLSGVNLCSHHITHEEQFCLAVVHDVVYLLRQKLVEDRHSHGAIGQSGEECHSPVGRVSSAESDLVALLHTAVFKHDVEFLYLAGYVVILQSLATEISQSVKVPVLLDTLLYNLIETWYIHCFL